MLPHDFPDYRHINYYLEWTRSGVWDIVLERVRELTRAVSGKQPNSLVFRSNRNAGLSGAHSVGSALLSHDVSKVLCADPCHAKQAIAVRPRQAPVGGRL